MSMAVVFNIQRFCVHDGPGIRTTVFLKGCNLNCRWCHNPESIHAKPQMQYFEEKCVGCGMCATQCNKGSCVVDKKRKASDDCAVCGRCAQMCMNDALKKVGEEMSSEQVMDVVRKDKKYYDNSGGGVTLSGGEPLLQSEFCAELFRMAQNEGIHTAVDTAANVPYSSFERVLPYTNAVLLDLKVMDREIHKAYTGVYNDLILENALKLFREQIDLYIRIPVIVGVNDTIENARQVAAFLKQANNIKEMKLLPYHNLGEDKSHSVGRAHSAFQTPDEETMRQLAAQFDRPVIY